MIPTDGTAENNTHAWCAKWIKDLELQVSDMKRVYDIAVAFYKVRHLMGEPTRDYWQTSAEFDLTLKAVVEKRVEASPGKFPDRSVNGCKCPCHAEIAKDGTGYPCGYDECAPCHVELPRSRS